MSPEILNQIDLIVSEEHRMNLVEQEHMAIDQLESYPGFKRQHRYLSRWRNENAICLTNFVIDHYRYRPKVSINFMSTVPPTTYADGIISIIKDYDRLHDLYCDLSRMALAEKLDELMHLSSEKIGWISKTKMKYMRDLNESANKSPDYVQLRSEHMHEKYRKKEMDFKVGY